MASAEASSNSSEISVLKAFKRKAMITRLITRNAIVPLLMVAARRGEGVGRGRFEFRGRGESAYNGMEGATRQRYDR